MAFVLAGGWIGDRVPIRRAMFVFGLAEAAAVGVLGFAGTLPMFCLSAALTGIGAGGRIPLTLAVHGVYFGRRNFATITGVSHMALNLAGEEGFGQGNRVLMIIFRIMLMLPDSIKLERATDHGGITSRIDPGSFR